MAITVRSNFNILLSRLKSLVNLQRINHTLRDDAGVETQFRRGIATVSMDGQGYVDPINWKKVDSRKYGISRSMVSSPSWFVLQVLRTAGFEAYLVGGCVRDLLLKKIPRDVDVVTSAELKQIRRHFARAQIVGRIFPICMVHVQGSIIEVSSFHTVAVRAEGKERKHIPPRFPQGCEEKDQLQWRDSMRRDFTINSLFFDPFANKIYDYVNGMKDIKSLQLRTTIPAQVSFKEDPARILRGLRIAARLGLTISNDTATAITILYPSISNLSESRIMMELNYMLSYGVGEPSLRLLSKFKLLNLLLPFHAAYFDQLAKEHSSERSMMLMKLFSNLDKMVTCDQPASCCLWVGLLAFHIALVNKPQDPLVVWTLASILYHGSWENGVLFARKNGQNQLNFLPEICTPRDYESDTELKEKVTQFASQVKASVEPLIERGSLFKLMSKFPNFPYSGLVFVPKKMGREAAKLFNLHEIESNKCGRRLFEINHDSLKKGDLYETQFAIGKVIMDTMSREIIGGTTKHNHAEETNQLPLSVVFKDQIAVSADKKESHSQSYPELLVQRQKIVEKNNTLQYEVSKPKRKLDDKHLPAQPRITQKMSVKEKDKDKVKKDVFVSEKVMGNTSQDGTTTTTTSSSTTTATTKNQAKVNEKSDLAIKYNQDVESKGKKSSPKEVRVKNDKNKDPVKETSKEDNHKSLSSLFK